MQGERVQALVGENKDPTCPHATQQSLFYFFNGWQECKDKEKKDPVSRPLPSNRKCKLKDNSCIQKEIHQALNPSESADTGGPRAPDPAGDHLFRWRRAPLVPALRGWFPSHVLCGLLKSSRWRTEDLHLRPCVAHWVGLKPSCLLCPGLQDTPPWGTKALHRTIQLKLLWH